MIEILSGLIQSTSNHDTVMEIQEFWTTKAMQGGQEGVFGSDKGEKVLAVALALALLVQDRFACGTQPQLAPDWPSPNRPVLPYQQSGKCAKPSLKSVGAVRSKKMP